MTRCVKCGSLRVRSGRLCKRDRKQVRSFSKKRAGRRR